MAQKTRVELACDLPGRHTDGVATIRVGLDGDEYEAEACGGHEDQLRRDLGPYLAHARPVRAVRGGRQPNRSAAQRRLAASQRAWAVEHGFHVNPKGRLRSEALRAWEAAQR